MARLSAVLLLTLAVLFGCSGTGTRDPGEFRVGIEGTPPTLDPRYAADAHGVRILPLLFQGLLAKAPSGELHPDLAESWEAPDPLTHRFRLREGVRFHDGSLLTARDVVETYRYVLEPAHGCPAAGSLSSVEAVEAPDDRTVVFRLGRPQVSLPFQLTLGILPRRLAARPDLGAEVVGTGPYRLAAFRPGEEILLEAFPDHFRGRPELDRLRFRIVGNATTRLLEIRSGGLDLLQNAVPPYAVKFLRRQEGLEVAVSPGASYQYLGYNLEDPILSDLRVRQALSHAVNREELITYALQGLARPATGVLPPEHWAHAEAAVGFAYDPARAKELLDAAGYPDPDGDGPGLRFTLSYKTSTDKTALEVARIVAEHFRRVGVGVEVRSFEWGTFFSDVQKGNFQVMSLRWIGLSDPDALHYLFHSASVPPNGANRGRYRNPEVDAWLDESRGEPDPARRRKLYGKVQAQVARDCVYLSLWWLDDVVVLRRGYEGYEPFPGGEYTSLARVRPRPEGGL
ncbi:MAG: ABC transporter substrate-binding protein [Deferrisomatales bacterium]|nr:ABC transporter substrate-binding protein [Deferrisomatales bacterium]